MELLPGDALRIGDPIFLALCIAAGRRTFVHDRHAGRPCPLFEFAQLVQDIGLQTQVINTERAAPSGDSEIHLGVVKHPFGIVSLDTRGFAGEQLCI